jgi:hypothetical protein
VAYTESKLFSTSNPASKSSRIEKARGTGRMSHSQFAFGGYLHDTFRKWKHSRCCAKCQSQQHTEIRPNLSALRSRLASTFDRCHESGSECNPRLLSVAQLRSPARAGGNWRIREDLRRWPECGRRRRPENGAVAQREPRSR